MQRRTTIGIAAGITLGLAAVALTIIVNLGIMSDAASSGPGNFVPTAALSTSQPPGTALAVDDLSNATDPVVDDASTATTTSQATDPDHEADSAPKGDDNHHTIGDDSHHSDDSHHDGRDDDD